ncbi:hypothetical protein H0H87_004310 [Tephrocybe sp. NHM501043]|nr:hypothetical protein H0H87_004310 [Tephrocybe sp. NHM501043]
MEPIHLPLDILGAIIETLIAENRANSLKTLKACGLVTRVYASQVQRYLFSAIYIQTKYACWRFASLLARSPHLAGYVQELCLYNDDSKDHTTVFHAEDAIAEILASVTNLQTIQIFYKGYRQYFPFLSDKIRMAFFTRSQTVTRIHCRGFHTLPMETFLSYPKLKDLTLHTNVPSSKIVWRVAQNLPLEPTGQICRLDRLNLDHVSLVEYLLQTPPYHQTALTSLVVANIPFATAVELISHSSHSLRRLAMSNMQDRPPSASLDLELPNLKSLLFSATMQDGTTVEQLELCFIASLLECGRTTVPRLLLRLDLTLRMTATDAHTTAASEAWTRIDLALADLRYECFEKVHLVFSMMTRIGGRDEEDVIRERTLQMLPLLNKTNRVMLNIESTMAM